MSAATSETSSESLSPAPEPGHRFTVTAHLEPSVLSRVVELFVLRDLIPHDLRCRQVGVDGLRIDVTVRGLTADKAEHVAARIRQFSPVLSVLLRG